MLTEQFDWNPDTGEMTAHSTWEYKPPMAADVPLDFRTALLPRAPSAWGFMRSKASGEPPRALAASVLLSVQHAVGSARLDAGLAYWPGALNAPATIDKVQQECGTKPDQFVVA